MCECDECGDPVYAPSVAGLGGVMEPMNPLHSVPTPQVMRKTFDESRMSAIGDFSTLVYLAQSAAHFLGL